MSVSVFVRLGVTAGVPLEFNTVETVKKLFSKYSVFIYGISTTPISYDEQDDCFDIGILDSLIGLNSEEEFKSKLKCIAELRKDAGTDAGADVYADADDGVIRLVRKRSSEIVNETSGHTNYTQFDLSDLWFEFFDHCSSLDAEFVRHGKTSYGTVGSAYNFMNRIKESVDYFISLGIPEENIDITHYNVLSI
jgi:hypothetical protein